MAVTTQRPQPRSGMTLVELVVSLALVSILMAACGSMLMVASKAMSNDGSNVGSDAAVARSATDQVIDDLKVATAVTEQTATAVTMTVPDRDGDGSAETIRYSWTGTAGDPLLRAYNARAAAVVAANVRGLNFTYLTKKTGKPDPVTGAEESIYAHATVTSGDIKTQTLDGSKWTGQYFIPTDTLAQPNPTLSSATKWTITRCQFMLQRNTLATGTVTLTVKYADSAYKPTGAALQSSSVLILNVLNTGLAWTEMTFASPVSLDPTKGVCLVVSYASILGSGGFVGYDDKNNDTTTVWFNSTDGGSTWSTKTDKAMQFKVWGTVTTQDSQTLDFQPLPPSSP